jgi:hypothetical protein
MKNNLGKIKYLYFLKLIMTALFNSYGQGQLHQFNDTIYNSFNAEFSLEKNIICAEYDVVDTLLKADGLMILFCEYCQENFLYDDNRKKLFNLGKFSGSMGIFPSEVSLTHKKDNEIGILYYIVYCKFGFCSDIYLFYSYYIDKNFVLVLCSFIDISIVEMGKEKNNAIYNEYEIDIENRKITVYEYMPYKYKNKRYKTNTMKCYW